MIQAMLLNPISLLLLLVFLGILYYSAVRVRAGQAPVLRRIRAFEALKGFTGQAVETGRKVHLSLGIGSAADQTTADSLAGLYILDYLAKQAAVTRVPPIVTMADPTVMLFAQNVLRKAHTQDPEGAAEAYRHVRWIAPQPAAYAAGVMNILTRDEVKANVMVGSFGDEYLLMGETAAWYRVSHLGGTSNPNTLPFIYVSADEILLGEEIYAGGAYLQRRPFHLGSLMAQDTVRWIVAIVIIGGVVIASVS